MPTWFWFSPTSMAICRFGTPSAARSTMRARCATRRDTCSPCALRSNSRRSSFVMRSAGTIRIALPSLSQFPSSPAATSTDKRRSERLDECRLVFVEPTEAGRFRLDRIDNFLPDFLGSIHCHAAGADPEDPDEPLHPEDGRQRPDLARRQALDLVVGRHEVGAAIEVEPARRRGEGLEGGGQVEGPQVVAGSLEARQAVGRPTWPPTVEDDAVGPEAALDHEAGKGGPTGRA